MANAYEMHKSFFRIGPSGSLVILSGEASGLTPPSMPNPQDMREIPSQSPGRRFEPVGTSQYTFDFVVDWDDTTNVIYNWLGQRLSWELGMNVDNVDANLSSGVKWTGNCYITDISPADDSGEYRLTVSCQGDGLITRTTYS